MLYNEDGSIYMTIEEGIPFRIGNQMRKWFPVRRGGVIVCEKYRDNGRVLESFALPDGKKGLWAVSSGSARNGVFHNYKEPKTELEAKVVAMGHSPSIIKRVPKIDIELVVGGKVCHHNMKKNGFDSVHDGESEDVTEPDFVFHGRDCCLNSTYIERVWGGTYLIYYQIRTTSRYLENIYITPEADEAEVIKEMDEIAYLV